MKKVLVFLLTLSFAASAFAIDFGNGLTLAGEVKAGVRVLSQGDGNDDTEDTSASFYNADAGQNLRYRLTFGYTGDWGGAKIRLQSDDSNVSTGSDSVGFYAKYAYGWINLLDGKVVVSGGHIGDDLWGLGKLGANVFDPSLDAVIGARVAFNIVDGLSFGVAFPFNGVTYYNYDSSEFKKKTGARTLGDAFGGAVIGGLYKSSLFSAAAGVRLYSAIDSKAHGGAADTSDGTKYGDVDGYADIIAGVEVNPVDGIKVVVDSRFDTRKLNKDKNIQDSKVGYARIGPLVQYSAGPLTAHLRGDITLQNDGYIKGLKGKSLEDVALAVLADGVDADKVESTIKGWHAADWVPVEKLGDSILGIRAGAAYQVSELLNAYVQIGSDNIGYIKGAGLYIKPGVKFTVGGGSIEIFDKVNRLGAEDLKAGTKDYSPINNQIQIDFNWVF
jgi:hypothetical protein